MKKYIVLLVLISSIVLSGCVDNTTYKQKQEISIEEYHNIRFYKFPDCDKSMTKDGCNNYRYNKLKEDNNGIDSVDKLYLVGEGGVVDVVDGIITLKIYFKNQEHNNLFDNIVILDVKDRTTTLNLRKNEYITFKGKIDYEKQCGGIVNLCRLQKIYLYDGEVSEWDGNIKNSEISSNYTNDNKNSQLREGKNKYHIDSIPSGLGKLYINGKESPTRGIFPNENRCVVTYSIKDRTVLLLISTCGSISGDETYYESLFPLEEFDRMYNVNGDYHEK